jgi:rhamnogalacturonyl hydrolase YesR
MWLDGLYMGEPFYAEWAATFKEDAAFDDVAKAIHPDGASLSGRQDGFALSRLG